MAIYITGDQHANFNKIFNFVDFLDIKLNSDDYVIILGDMGIFWRDDKEDAKKFIEFFEKNYQFNLYFIEGNHENFNLLNDLPEDENGMGYISEHIRHLKRGRRYNIQGKNILAIGGADSIDKYHRTEGISWWKEEQITDDDVVEAIGHGDIVFDYVLSHAAPAAIFNEYKYLLCDYFIDEDDGIHISENKLEIIKENICFKHWYFRSLSQRYSFK